MYERRHPVLPVSGGRPTRPISFIVVKFSDEYYFNVLKSEAVTDTFNELITVDNTGNLHYDNLGEAMRAGMSKARHELIAVVHEDVLLPDNWQGELERTLEALEEAHPDWGVLGAVGWTDDEEIVGHWSDPGLYMNTFGSDLFRPVARLDEQLLVFHRNRPIPLDPDLPSVHHIGRDVCLSARQLGLDALAIHAPTIHKYADEKGRLIVAAEDSPKTVERGSRRFHADYTFSTEYLTRKWPHVTVINQHYAPCEFIGPEIADRIGSQLARPIILLGRGGGGSRLLGRLCRDLGVFLGSELNDSNDSLEMAIPIFHAIMEKYRGRASWQREQVIPRLRSAAARMLLTGERPLGAPWGFKLPESLLLLPELRRAFSDARFLHLVRDPVATCLRRTHLTARLDNCIGRISLPVAYEHVGRKRIRILDDVPAVRMAYTTRHQLEEVAREFSATSAGRFMQLRFEDVVARPTECLEAVSLWLGLDRVEHELEKTIDPVRARPGTMAFPAPVEAWVREIVKPLQIAFGYVSG